MSRNRSLPSRKVTVYVPEEAYREFRGAVAQRDFQGDRLGNPSPEQSALSVGATAKIAAVVLDDIDFGDLNFQIKGDGSLVATKSRDDDSGRWL